MAGDEADEHEEPPRRPRLSDGRAKERTLRARLRTCAVVGDVDGARAAVIWMERLEYPVGDEEHLLVLIAHQASDRAVEAEEYFRSIPEDQRTMAHFRSVMATYTFKRRPHDVERLYLELESTPDALDDDCRSLLLSALAFEHEDARARVWFQRFEQQSDEPPGPGLVAHLINAHAYPGAHDQLVAIHDRLDEELLHEPEVASTMVRALVAAGDPERAERCLRDALAVVEEDEERERLVGDCIRGRRRDREAVRRLLATAEEAGVDVEHLGSGFGILP